MKTLLRFLQNGKTQFHVAALAKEYLDAHNFTQISDRENLTELAAGRYYLAPFSSIVIPFVKGAQSTQVRIACAHTDFPMLKVKPNPELKKLGYLQINVEPYGGLIKETWFDRPLGLAGKVILKGDTSFHPEVRLFDSQKPVAIIPNLAPHLKRGGKEEELTIMSNRRDFLKTAAFAALGSGMAINHVFAGGNDAPSLFNVNSRAGVTPKMKLRFFPYELKLRHVFTVATYSRTTTPDVQVEIEYDGIIGYGEASMPPYLQHELGTMDSVLAFLKKVQDVIGQFSDPFQLEDILAYIDSLSAGDSAAKTAVDIALHDLVGKLLQAPWYKIWGLDKEKTPSTTFTIGIDTADVVREKTKECADRFNILKVKLGRENDKEMIETIRSVTDLPIAIDANQGWKDKHHALDMIHWLHEKGIVMIEQPMPKEQLDDIAWVTQQSPLPIFADESIQRLKDVAGLKGAFTGINIKLMKCTGMREAWKMVTVARALDMKVMVGCMTETSCAITAASQFSPAVDFADLDGSLLIANDRFKGMEVVKGKITLPDLPGIGVVKL